MYRSSNGGPRELDSVDKRKGKEYKLKETKALTTLNLSRGKLYSQVQKIETIQKQQAKKKKKIM